jgi:hypothetical protein
MMEQEISWGEMEGNDNGISVVEKVSFPNQKNLGN